MPKQELQDMVDAANRQQAREDELASYMDEAGRHLLAGDYAAAAQRYREVLEADSDNEEASRGFSEAEKGARLAALTPEQLQAHIAAEMGEFGGGGGAAPLASLLGVEEGQEASERAAKFDSTKKLPKRAPHHPTRPVDQGPKGPTFIT